MPGTNIDITLYFRNAAQAGEQVNNFRARVLELSAAITKSKNEIDRLNEYIKQQRKALQDGQISQSKYKQSVEGARKSIDNETKSLEKNVAAMKNATKGTKDATTSANKFNFAIRTKNALLQNSAYLLTRWFGAFAAISLVKNTIQIIAEFEKAMKQVEAISGATADEMERLTQVALSVGKIYTPKEVAELELILSKLGFTADEIDKSTEAIVNLSIATGEDLATSAELAASIVRGFNLDVAETAKVTETLAAGLNSSALSLSNTREAIKYVAPIAAQLGWTFEEVTAALGKLSNAQIAGSLAGTSMRNIMAELANKSSKLYKVLGEPKSFDEFVEGLQKINEEGVNLDDIFKLVPKRATSALAVLLMNADGLKQYRDELDNTSGAIQRMVDIQEESLSNKTLELKANWQAFVSSVDTGSGVISFVIKNLISGIDELLMHLKAINEFGFRPGARGMLAYQQYLQDMLEQRKKGEEAYWDGYIKMYKKQLDFLAEYEKKSLNSVLHDQLLSLNKRKVYLERDNKLLNAQLGGWITNAYAIGKNNKELETISKKLEYINKLLGELGEENGKGLDMGGAGGVPRVLSDLREQKEMSISLLKAEMEAEEERIKMVEEGARETILLLKNELKYKILINQETLMWDEKIAKASGENQKYILNLKKLAAQKAREIDNEYFGGFVKLLEESRKKLDKYWDQIFSEDLKNYKMKLRDEFSNVTPRELSGANFWDDLVSPSEEQRDAILDAVKLFTNAFEDIADAQVDAIDRIVDRYNQMYEETQRALEIETELMAAGYANNVTAKKNELAQIQAQREIALKQQQEYVKQQQQIETVIQAVNMTSAVVNILKEFTKLGPWGLLGASGAIAALFALWKNAKIQAINEAYKFEEGGWVKGKPHSKGGKWINAEGGEYIINKESSEKFAPLLEAINTGHKIPLEFVLDRNLVKDLDRKQHGLDIMQHRVSLDDGKAHRELKTIRKILSDKNGVEYRNGYRIERIGNRTRKIYDN